MSIKKYLINLLRSGKSAFPEQYCPNALLRFLFRSALFLFLRACSLGYEYVVRLRCALYHQGIFHQAALPCPVVSIGNITTGGTGKTPAVIEVAQIFRQHGKRVAILTRGYRRDPSIPTIIVDPMTDVRLVGDEPLLMAQKLKQQADAEFPSISIIAGSQRYLSGKLVIERFQADVMLLDDGFQHLQLARTLDIVLIDATDPFGGNYLLPAGFLREPVDHLRRANAFIITRSDEITDITPISQILQQFNPAAPIFTAVHAYNGLRKMTGASAYKAVVPSVIPLETITPLRLLAVSGLGNPASFHRLLAGCGLQAAHCLDFPDHAWYTEQDLATIRQICEQQQLDAIITTEKDEVKLLQYVEMINIPWYVIAIRLEIRPEKAFEQMLLEKIKD